MKYVIFFFLVGLFTGLIALMQFFTRSLEPGIEVTKAEKEREVRLFPIQCVDTMKVSRDKARLLKNDPNAEAVIEKHVQTISSLGANCIAIGTPYDEEFLPYLKLWVSEARKYRLAVWFRGNWSSWEGWFSYKKTLTPDERIEKTASFIKDYPELFQDGDIFSPSVEPENGGPFYPIDSAQKREELRVYLIKEQSAVKQAFRKIRKNVETTYVSMSGGVARTVVNAQLLSSLQNTVTLDHYVRSPEGIGEYIHLFKDPYNASLVFGEFGAPIPDLNGEMDEVTQAGFVDSLLWQMTLERDSIKAVNYWTLSESSTALMNEDGTLRSAIYAVKKYYIPGEVAVSVVNTRGYAMKGVLVTTSDNQITNETDTKGKTELVLPQGSYTVKLMTQTGKSFETPIVIGGKDLYSIKAVFEE